jgi:LAGLIDADG-like domain
MAVIPVTPSMVQDIVDDNELRELWIVGREMERPPWFHAGKGGDMRLAKALRVVQEGRVTPNSDGSYTVEGSEGRTYRCDKSCSCPQSQKGPSKHCYHMVSVALYVEWRKRCAPVPPIAPTFSPVTLGTLRAGTAPLPDDDDALGNGFPVDDETLPLPLPPVSVDERLAQAAAAARDHVYDPLPLPQEDGMTEDEVPYMPEPDDAPVTVLERQALALAPVAPEVLDLEVALQTWTSERAIVQRFLRQELKANIDYYTLRIGGKDSKPSLSKAGAEKVMGWLKLQASFAPDTGTWEMLGKPQDLVCYVCADEETEILTTHGWKDHTDLQHGDLVAQVDPTSERMFWGPILDLHRYAVTNERLMSLRSGRMHMLVTKNHQCLVYRQHQTKLHFLTAEEVTQGCRAPIIRPWAEEQEPETGPSLPMAELLGWYISEGNRVRRQKRFKHLYHATSIEINQSLSANPEKCTRIRTLLQEVGATFRERIGHSRGEKIIFTVSGSLAEQLIAYAPEKSIPIGSLLWPQQTIAAFLAGLIGGDGTCDVRGRQTFIQAHKPSCDMVQALWARLGIPSVVIPVALHHGHKPVWHVYEQARVNRRTPNIEEVPYTGIVWCPETASHTWLARRNGHLFLTGNCTLRTRSGEIVGEGRGARSIKKDGGDVNKAIKMAEKSANVSAVLRTGCLSDVFTSDLEDMQDPEPAKPTMPARPSSQDLRSRIWARVQVLAPEVRTREAVEAFIQDRTGLTLHPDAYSEILGALEHA